MTTAYGAAVPYNGFLTSQFGPGTRIEINGVVQPYGNSFAVNLKTASGAILLHFNPRFNERVMVLNSNRAGSWEQEVRPPGFPFSKGMPFSLNITCEISGISVAVNGSPVAAFAHRGAYQEIKVVEITGDVQLQMFREHPVMTQPSFSGGMMQPGFGGPTMQPALPGYGGPTMQPALPGYGGPTMQPALPGGYGAPMMQGLPVPYKAPISGGMQPGRQLLITGTATGDRFEVNLRCGSYEGSDVALHFNPRFNDGQVVRNTCTNGGWGGEERHGSFPFQRGVPFTIQIVCEYTGYKVFVNGTPHSEFRHRIQPPQRVDTVQITGSISLTSCTC